MNSSSQQEEIDVLGTQLTELDHEIDTLMTKRAKMRRRFNRFQAHTSVLPPETLSIIFQYACDLPDTANIDDDHRPVTISSVSVHWRVVAQSTPPIWNRLCVNLKHPRHASVAAFSLIQLYFKYLGSQRINLRLLLDENHSDWEDNEDAFPGVPIQSVFQFVLTSNPTKLHALFINEFSLEWSRLFIKNIHPDIGLPNLNQIYIGWSRRVRHDHSWDDSNVFPLNSALIPKLTDVSLAQASPNFLIPHEQITDLHLEDVPIDYCLEVMTRCPNALECHVFYPQPPSDFDMDPPERPVTLSRTTCLGWAFGIQRWDVAFLKYYTFPALERFRCENQGEDGIEEDEGLEDDLEIRALQRKFLARCPKLTVYERAAESFINWHFNDLCDDLPDTVEELYLRQATDDEAKICFQRLTRGEDWTMSIFPRLKVLELEGQFWYQLSWRIFPQLVEMLESRRRPLPEEYKDQFRIEELGLKWEASEDASAPCQLKEAQVAQMQEFVNQGLKVVTSDAKGKDKIWMPIKPAKS